LREDFGPESDIDVLIEPGPQTPRGFRPRLTMEQELESLFGRRVDLVYRAGLVNPIRRQEILQTAQILYAA
jgi:predicted nucleotidyltransferase